MCSRRAEVSPRVLKTVPALLQLTGFVKARRGPTDRHSKFYQPTERMPQSKCSVRYRRCRHFARSRVRPGQDDHRQPAVTIVEKCLVHPRQQVTSRLNHLLRHQVSGDAIRQRDRKRVGTGIKPRGGFRNLQVRSCGFPPRCDGDRRPPPCKGEGIVNQRGRTKDGPGRLSQFVVLREPSLASFIFEPEA